MQGIYLFSIISRSLPTHFHMALTVEAKCFEYEFQTVQVPRCVQIWRISKPVTALIYINLRNSGT